jgi:hypothetical protein
VMLRDRDNRGLQCGMVDVKEMLSLLQGHGQCSPVGTTGSGIKVAWAASPVDKHNGTGYMLCVISVCIA